MAIYNFGSNSVTIGGTGNASLNLSGVISSLSIVVNSSSITSTQIFVGSGNDSFLGALGSDFVEGGNGNDTIDGGKGNDSLLGGNGDDLFFVDSLLDFIDGGVGIDSIETDLPSFTNFIGIEFINGLPVGGGGNNITGTPGNDVIEATSSPGVTGTPGNVATDFNDTIDGLAGNDSIDGLGGDDDLIGGDGNDTLLGGEGNDTIDGGAGVDTLVGGIGADVFFFASSEGDVINDFAITDDKIELSSSAFPGGLGILTDLAATNTIDVIPNESTIISSSLVIGQNTPIGSDVPTYLYDAVTGRLAIDRDGVGTSAVLELIATLTNLPTSAAGVLDRVAITTTEASEF